MSGGQDRKRIKAFGCSHTAQHHWLWLEKDKEKPGAMWAKIQNEHRLVEGFDDVEMINEYNPCAWKSKQIEMESWAMSGSGIDSQIALWSMLILNDNIRPSDTVIFQLTAPGRHTIPVNKNSSNHYGAIVQKLWRANRLEEVGCFQHIKNDYFTGEDQFAFDPSCTAYEKINEFPQSTQLYALTGRLGPIDPWRVHVLLSSLLAIKSFNKKMLILFGWNDNWRWGEDLSIFKNLLKAFDKFGIEYIDTSIVNYSIDHGHGIEDDGHATQKGYKAFTEKVLRQRLEQLGWI